MGSAFPSTLAMIAAFWSDIDLGNSTYPKGNRMYYSTYTDSYFEDSRSKYILNRISRDVRQYKNLTDFTARWALIATWYRVTPYEWVDYYLKNQV